MILLVFLSETSFHNNLVSIHFTTTETKITYKAEYIVDLCNKYIFLTTSIQKCSMILYQKKVIRGITKLNISAKILNLVILNCHSPPVGGMVCKVVWVPEKQ